MAAAPPLSEVLPKVYARIPLGMRLGLLAMREACARLGNPERSFAAIHVAGTNGKGSTAAMVESIARTQGLRTGLYTSPHLCRFAERIRLDGEPIDDPALARFLEQALRDPGQLSFFETATLAAFLAFREARVDIAVIEVGLGGRLDATNVLPCPRAAAITRIALDHMDRLGPTVIDIAREKAGIAKPRLDIVLGPCDEDVRAAIDSVVQAKGATTTLAHEAYPDALGTVGLLGAHQVDNARIAAALAHRMGASRAAIDRGLANVTWPGRAERIGRYCLDAAHNPDGAASLARLVESLNVDPQSATLIFGTLGDKDWRPMLAILGPLACERVYVAPQSPGRPPVDANAMSAAFPGVVADGMAEALAAAKGEFVIIAGSILLVGDARAALLGLARDPPVAL